MLQTKSNICFLVFVFILFLAGCNEAPTATSEESTGDTIPVATTHDVNPIPEYDPAMDSYMIGGKAVKKLGDTLGIKMYEFTAKPGESFALHTHPDHTAYVLQGGKAALFIKAAGRTDTLDFPTGMALISGPLSDSGRNIGKTTIKMVVTDIYRPRSK
ncbi:MAG TPA: hypothetical protein VFV68_02005 [Agriterribacter sp.]|nr:hypothetical protein [Agriterribacter sp.]